MLDDDRQRVIQLSAKAATKSLLFMYASSFLCSFRLAMEVKQAGSTAVDWQTELLKALVMTKLNKTAYPSTQSQARKAMVSEWQPSWQSDPWSIPPCHTNTN